MNHKRTISIVLGIMCFALTLGICIQVRTVQGTNSTVSQNYEENNLRAEVLKYKERYENKYKELEKAETELEKAKIFVLSSDYEGMPNALIEAMAVGLPVISTDCPCGGPKELIENKKNGVLVKIGDAEELSKNMGYLIENQEDAKNMGKNAEKLKEKLNSNNILKQWKIYIEEMKK